MKKWKNQLKKAPLDFRDMEFVTPRNPVRDNDMYLDRLRGVKPLENRSTQGPIQGKSPTPKEGFSELSEEQQMVGLNIARRWAQQTMQALVDYENEVGQRGVKYQGEDDTGMIKAYNNLMGIARSIEENYKRKPWYLKIFGRGRRYRKIVKQINDLGEKMNQAFRNYKLNLNMAQTDAERQLRYNKVNQSLKASLQTLQQVKNELNNFAQEPIEKEDRNWDY